jgi:predicted acylesterase/phospholipase RssA
MSAHKEMGLEAHMLIHPDRWQSLRGRYEQERPRRMLALDGGGIRGLLTLGILQQIEKLVVDQTKLKLAE